MRLPDVRDSVFLCNQHGATKYDIVKNREHKLHNLESVIHFREQFENPSVWIDRKQIAVVVDDDKRWDWAVMPLTFTPQLLRLQELEKRTPIKQAEAVLMLRTTFAYCLRLAGEIIAVLRQLKFRSLSSGASEVGHGKASIGRSLEIEITGAKAIPESIEIEVQLWDQIPSVTQVIPVAIELDPSTETIQFIPFPGMIEQAINHGLTKIYDLLDEDDAPGIQFIGSM